MTADTAISRPTLVELSFLSDPKEATCLDDDSYRDALGAAVARAIAGYLSKTYPGHGDYSPKTQEV